MATYSSMLAWESQGQRSQVGCSPWGHKESDPTEQTRAFHHLFKQSLKLSVLLPICCFTHITLKVCKCYLHKFLKVVSGSKRVCF